MEIKQALSIVAQAIDVAVANGSFKSADDVAVVSAAKKTVEKYVEDCEASKGAQKNLPKKESK